MVAVLVPAAAKAASATAAAGASPLAQNTVVPGRGATYTQPAANPSLGETGMAEYLNLLQSPGTMTGGTAAYTVSGAAGRNAATAAYNQTSADSRAVYSDAVNQVLARQAGIGTSYDNAAAAIQSQSGARDTQAANEATLRASRNSAGAAGLGLGFTPTTADRAGGNQLAQTSKSRTNADSWSGLLSAQKQTALTGNKRTADAFTYSGAQAQNALSALLQKAIAAHPDVFHAGSAGKLTGAATLAQKLAGAQYMVSTQQKNDAASLNANKFFASQQPTTTKTTSTNNLGTTTNSVSTKGKG